jgi:hypothetical protein
MKLDTKCVQGGYNPKNGEPRVAPIVQSTTFAYDTPEEMGDLFDLKKAGYFYTRFGNPTLGNLEEKVSLLEGGIDVTSETPDKEGFDTKYVIKFKDADGNEVEIVIYLNMVLLVDGEEDTTTEVDLDDFDEEESEQEFSVDGIIVIGDKEYSVIGTYEVSSETEV